MIVKHVCTLNHTHSLVDGVRDYTHCAYIDHALAHAHNSTANHSIDHAHRTVHRTDSTTE